MLIGSLLGASVMVSGMFLAAAPPASASASTTNVNWPVTGEGAGHTYDNPNETTLTPTSVSGLAAWRDFATGLGSNIQTSSPVVVGGIVYVSGTNTNCVVGTGGSTSTTPECAELYALNIASGKIKWKVDLDDVNGQYSPYCGGNPIVADSVIVLSCGYQIDGFAMKTGDYLWQNAGSTCYISSDEMVSSGSTVYVSCQNGMGALDATDGANVWSVSCNPSDPSGPCTSQIAVVDNTVYAADGYIYGGGGAFSQAPSSVSGSSGVAAYKGVLYYTSGSAGATVTAVRERTMKVLWSTTTACNAIGGPDGPGADQVSVADGDVFVGCVAGEGVYAYSTATGELVWGNPDVGINGERPYAPTVGGDVAYLLSGGSLGDAFSLTAVSTSTGDQLFTTGNTLPDNSENLSGPVVVNGDVIFTDGAGNVEVYHL